MPCHRWDWGLLITKRLHTRLPHTPPPGHWPLCPTDLTCGHTFSPLVAFILSSASLYLTASSTMANESRSFGAPVNPERRAFAPLNIQNKHADTRHNNHKQVSVNSFAGQENIVIANEKIILAHKSSKAANYVDYTKINTSFQIYDDGIFSQETVQSNNDEKILDDNIEAVKKELNSFLIDSLEKCDSVDLERENKENKCEDSLMIVDCSHREESSSLSDSVLDQSELSFSQIYSDIDLFKDYADSILPYMLEKERKYMADSFYMNNQPHINSKMRSILVDWLVDVSDEYNIKDETLFLAISYIDRYFILSICNIY